MTFDSEPDRLFMACTQLTAVYCCCCYYYYYYHYYYLTGLFSVGHLIEKFPLID